MCQFRHICLLASGSVINNVLTTGANLFVSNKILEAGMLIGILRKCYFLN